MTDVETAEQIISGLSDQRSHAAARVREIAEKRKSLAFAALAERDPEARNSLDALNAESVSIAGEIEGFDAALAEARARLEAAKTAEALEADREKARELRGQLGKFAEHGHNIDAALTTLVSESIAFQDTLSNIHSLGCEFPSHGLAETNARLAIDTALMQTPWRRNFAHLAPGERRTFVELVTLWVERIDTAISHRLGEAKKEAA